MDGRGSIVFVRYGLSVYIHTAWIWGWFVRFLLSFQIAIAAQFFTAFPVASCIEHDFFLALPAITLTTVFLGALADSGSGLLRRLMRFYWCRLVGLCSLFQRLHRWRVGGLNAGITHRFIVFGYVD